MNIILVLQTNFNSGKKRIYIYNRKHRCIKDLSLPETDETGVLTTNHKKNKNLYHLYITTFLRWSLPQSKISAVNDNVREVKLFSVHNQPAANWESKPHFSLCDDCADLYIIAPHPHVYRYYSEPALVVQLKRRATRS